MSKNKISKTKGGHKTWRGIAVLLAMFIVPMWICGVFDSPDASQKPSHVTLSASVSYGEGQFVVSNHDVFDWINVELEINGAGFKSGFKTETSIMIANTVYTVGALQFAKSDGTRFNPFLMKPQTITIRCDTPNGSGTETLKW